MASVEVTGYVCNKCGYEAETLDKALRHQAIGCRDVGKAG